MVAITSALLFGALASSAVAAPQSAQGLKLPTLPKIPLPPKHLFLPPVNSKLLQHSIKLKALMKGAQKLQDLAYATPDRNRMIGGKGHEDTVAYIKRELEALDGYYKVELQPFTTLVQLSGSANLTISNQTYSPGLMEYSPSGTTTASLVVVNNLGCSPSDYPSSVSGNVALISRGTCEFGLKSVLAGNAGATAAIIYNNIPGNLSATLGPPPRPEGEYVPTVGISLEEGTALVQQITGGATVTASLDVETNILNATTNNVIATTTHGNANTTLMLGAHSDSVAAGPGINDDGSGTIAILEVAKQLAKWRVNNQVRFGFWSAEEEGLIGSTYYVENLPAHELNNIRAYLNFDMIASPNFVYAIYDGDGSAYNLTGPVGSAEIEKFFQKWFDSERIPWTASEFSGRSDYQAFIDNGIPAGGTDTGADGIKTEEEARIFGGTAGIIHDPNYHTVRDDINNLNQTAFHVNGRAIAAAVAEYARSFASLPPKAPVKRSLVKKSIGADAERRRRAMKKKLALS